MPRSMTANHLLVFLKKRLDVKINNKAATSVFLFVDQVLVQPSDRLGEVLARVSQGVPHALILQYS